MRVKLNRYEFALKEAVIFLSKPIEKYNAWLKSGADIDQPRPRNPSAPVLSQHPAQLAISQQIKSGFLQQQQSQLHQYDEKTAENLASMLPSTSLATTGEPVPSFENVEWDAVTKEITTEDVPNLECIRLALNYLKSAQSAVNAVSIEKIRTNQIAIVSAEKDEEQQHRGPTELSSTFSSAASEPRLNEGAATVVVAAIDQGGSQSRLNGAGGAPREFSVYSTRMQSQMESFSQKIAKARLASDAPNAASTALSALPVEEDDEGDLALGHESDEEFVETTTQASKKSRPSVVKCTNCIDLMLRIDHLTDQVSYLKRDVMTLGSHLAEERATKERIQLSKDMLDQEVEELTAQMFDQANRMVIDEAKLREHFENSNFVLKGELKDLLKKFLNRGQELKDLKKCLVALDAAKQRSLNTYESPRSSITNINSDVAPTQSGLPASVRDSAYKQQHIGSFLSTRIGPNNTLVPFIPVDSIVCGEFKEFIKVLLSITTSPTPQSMATLLNTVFLKRCLVEDVEPCLLYTYQQPSAGIYFKNATSMPTAFRKKLIEAVMRCGCEIKYYWSSKEDLFLKSPNLELGNGLESVNAILGQSGGSAVESPTKQQLAESPSTASNEFAVPKKKCSCCNVIKDCDYKMRFSLQEKKTGDAVQYSEWYPTCRFCRDRVTCVGDFFAYITHMKQGLVGPGKAGFTILGIFRHLMWLKRRMALARVGSMALFEGDILPSIEGSESHKSEEATLENMVLFI